MSKDIVTHLAVLAMQAGADKAVSAVCHATFSTGPIFVHSVLMSSSRSSRRVASSSISEG